MPLSRRDFLVRTGGALTYVICAANSNADVSLPSLGPENHRALMDRLYPGIQHRDWIKISADGQVTAFTARNELGQGLTTVMVNVLSQGLELPAERFRVVMGDTDLCPNDGPTTGSCATQQVAWSFWIACLEIRDDLVQLAAARLGRSPEDMSYRQGLIYANDDPAANVLYNALAYDRTTTITVSEGPELPRDIRAYNDPGTVSVHADAIVTGTIQYTSDLRRENVLYGALLLPPYHRSLAKIETVDVSAALRVQGVKKAGLLQQKFLGIVGDSFAAVQNGLAAVDVRWKVPKGPAALPIETVIRQGRSLVDVLEHRGSPFNQAAPDQTVVSETYVSQYGTQVPIETSTALAEKTGDKFVIHIGSQNPFKVRRLVAKHFGLPEESVRVVSMPAGGAFGAKTGDLAGLHAAMLADWAGVPVKLVRSRRDDIQRLGRYKAAVVFDVISAVNDKGRLVSQQITMHEDVGNGTRGVYDIPNTFVALYKTRLPFKRAIMRGTSYVQNVWALECHVDMLATAAGLDPLEFRRRNVLLKKFLPLLDNCADLINYHGPSADKGHGVGFAMIRHGAFELGVVAVEVSVNAASGEIAVLQMAGAFDIGLVMNSTLAETGVKSSMLWGLSWALLEEVKLDRHKCHTTGFANYQIARFEHTPEIKVRFLGDTSGGPRGCGEMPGPPVAAAISNAVYHATGVRFYDLPLTPEKVRAALAA